MHPSAFEPILPPVGGPFESVAISLHREAAALRATAHPATRRAIATLLRTVNSYYSNLIEGVRTTPADIDAAMRADFSHDPGRAAAQRLAVNHVRVEAVIMDAIDASPETAVTNAGWLRDVHRALYAGITAKERMVRSPTGRELILEPGEIRSSDVTVGSHLAPPPESVPAFLDRFHDVYRPEIHSEVWQVVAFAASHHRLAWIHPFLDGNGRVTRLMTTAYARKIDLDAGGLWSVARGFARYRAEYYAALAAADAPRRSALDGRGSLSLAALEEWCSFMTRVALDQLTYMRTLLQPDTLADRLRGYAAFKAVSGPDSGWRTEAGDLLAALVSRGSVARADALRMLPGGERTARAALSVLIRDGAVTTDSHRAPIRLGFSTEAAQIVFPGLIAA